MKTAKNTKRGKYTSDRLTGILIGLTISGLGWVAIIYFARHIL